MAAEEAADRGLKGKWVFTLHAPSRLPLLQYADDRDLRQQMYRGYTSLASSGQYDNKPIINKILQARARKAHLLGFPDFGSYMTDNVMAKTVNAAEDLLMQIWRPAVKRVQQEVAEMQQIVNDEGGNFKIAPWDYYYYAEKVRKKKYDLDENQVRRYFALDSVRKGIFTMAERLYNIRFTEMPDAPKYYPEVKVYDVTDAGTGEHIAVFMTDYFPRASKRQGAWMSEFKGSWINDDGTADRPIIFNVGNFSKPTADAPSLLTLDEVETMFHEFGHGLHGMLSRARYKCQSGTNVDRDFVELPSQIHEHWAMDPELLRIYAHDYQTGEVIPDALIENSRKPRRTTRASLPPNWPVPPCSTCNTASSTPQATLTSPPSSKSCQRPRNAGRTHLPLSLDILQAHLRQRRICLRILHLSVGRGTRHRRLRTLQRKRCLRPRNGQVLPRKHPRKGGSVDPMQLFINFRGHKPGVDALLRNRGLETPEKHNVPSLNKD